MRVCDRQWSAVNKSVFLATLCAMLFALCTVPEAQQPKKIPRIGYVSSGDAASESSRSEALKMALRDLGYIDGQNIDIEYRFAEGKRERRREIVSELVRLKVDIIVIAGGETWIREAKNATKTIPIVMMGGGANPVEAGLC